MPIPYLQTEPAHSHIGDVNPVKRKGMKTDISGFDLADNA
jgi:hypothetical protein